MADLSAPMKIWYQSFVHPSEQADYFRYLHEALQPLVDGGAEVIIPAGGLPALLFSRLKEFTVGKAVVLNCIAALAKMTEMAVKLYRLNGTRVSRALTFAKPSDKALREFWES